LFQGKVQDLVRDDETREPNPAVMLLNAESVILNLVQNLSRAGSFQHLIKVFSASGRYIFIAVPAYRQAQDGVSDPVLIGPKIYLKFFS